MRHLVVSRDGVVFEVESYPNTVAFDRRYAESHDAVDLELQGDFVRADGAPQPLREPLAVALTGYGRTVDRHLDEEVEALRRARAAWGVAGYVVGDKAA